MIGVFEDADRDPSRIDQGALRFVIVGGGPTGVELAGALADMIHDTMTAEFHDLAVSAAEVHIVDLGHPARPVLRHAHDYVAKILHRKGVHVHLGVTVTEVTPDHVVLADGTKFATRCVIWVAGSRRRRWPPRPVSPRVGAGASTSRTISASRAFRAST